jgi:hypothetical protein
MRQSIRNTIKRTVAKDPNILRHRRQERTENKQTNQSIDRESARGDAVRDGGTRAPELDSAARQHVVARQRDELIAQLCSRRISVRRR